MGKQPTQGQKKTKDHISKAASQKKAGHKKWTKGKTKEKADHAVFLSRQTYDRILDSIPKLNRHIGVSQVIEKYKVSGSIARALIRKSFQRGDLKCAEKHCKQALFTPTVPIIDKPAATEKESKKDKKKK